MADFISSVADGNLLSRIEGREIEVALEGEAGPEDISVCRDQTGFDADRDHHSDGSVVTCPKAGPHDVVACGSSLLQRRRCGEPRIQIAWAAFASGYVCGWCCLEHRLRAP